MVTRRLIAFLFLVFIGFGVMPGHEVYAQCLGLQCTQTAIVQTETAVVSTQTAVGNTLTRVPGTQTSVMSTATIIPGTQTAVGNTATAAEWTHVAIVSTQTAVALITPSATPIPYYRYEEINPDEWVRWDYSVTAGELMQGGLILLLVLTLWIFAALFFIGRRRKPDV